MVLPTNLNPRRFKSSEKRGTLAAADSKAIPEMARHRKACEATITQLGSQ
jgi:hypothetical protein